MNVQKNDEAVSPVIGVILMVAITVILAAMVTVLVFNETDKIQPSEKSVILQGSATGSSVTVELISGADVVELTALKFSFGADYPEEDTIIANGYIVNEGYTVTSGQLSPSATNGTEGSSVDIFSDKKFSVGDTFQMDNDGGKFTVVGIFADGTEQVLYTKTYPIVTE
ncbi:flagellin-like protein [Methanofollis sp. W23]|uniref:type IV pilin n=1 Tax=Methanofollis sp. W23 TaxID=2817849 RepID=UPI001AE6ED84|nr:type IV pilin N-terminal domain-containing protein [Methanofollis sp. W23]MBP2147238.1 flagellin-like protein [Methanofollis sp. W23]